MQFAHTLEKRKVLNVLSLDVVRQRIVVGSFPFLRLLVGFGGKWNMLGHDGFHLRGHFLDLRMSQGLNAEVVILLKLIVHDIVAAVNLRDYVTVHNLIARQLQEVKSAYRVVALSFWRLQPLSDKFSEFIIQRGVKIILAAGVKVYCLFL